MKTRTVMAIVVVLLFVVAGCQLASDMFWPVKTAKEAEKYLGKAPEEIEDVQSLAEAKDTRQEVITHHVETQLDAKHVMEKDKAKYKIAIKQSSFNIEEAETEREIMIGTIEKPGWLTSILLGASGFGLYVAGARKQRPEDYNEGEFRAEVAVEVGKVLNVRSEKDG